MRYLIAIIVSLYPSFAFADWQSAGGPMGEFDMGINGAQCPAGIHPPSQFIDAAKVKHPDKPLRLNPYNYCRFLRTYRPSQYSAYRDRYEFRFSIQAWDGPIEDLDLTDGIVFEYAYSDEQCNAVFGGAKTYFVSGEVDGFKVANIGACSAAATGLQVCEIQPNGQELCAADWVAVSTGEVLSANDYFDYEEENFPPDYMTPVNECSTGSCIEINGEIYEVDQSEIDSGRVSIIGGSGGGDNGSGDTGGGDSGGSDGGSGGDGGGSGDTGGGSDSGGSGGSGGDSGGGSDGSGGSGGDGDGSGDGDGFGASPWSSGDVIIKPFDQDGEGEQLLADAEQRLQQAFAEIRQEIRGFNFSVGGGGGGCSTYTVANVTLDPCEKIDQFASTARGAVMFLAALLSVGIILRSRD